MPGNWKLHNNGGVSDSSNSSADKVEEAMRRLKLESNGDGSGGAEADTSGPYPDRPGEPDCIYYLRTGTCGYGSNCRFNHPSDAGGQGVQNTGELPERIGQPDCVYYLKTGTCKYGSTCKYHHPKDRHGAAPILLNMVGLPMRQDAKPCPHYMRTGLCKYGYSCKFHHPQPGSTANILPVPGPIAYASGGSSISPSSVLSYGELPASSLAKAKYVSSSQFQVPQSYMPFVLSPTQGWTTYMGTMNPVPVSSVLGDLGSNGQISVSDLPDRPDQPECRYFMNNGSCKYGSECKYHHPREKITQLASNTLGPLGLPLRPGQPVCSFYSLYGLCKYGPTCKFDHPLEGYSYSYGLSIPPGPLLDLSLVSYQRGSSAVPLPESSPSKPSKSTDWNKKSATANRKGRQLNSKDHGNSPERANLQLQQHPSKESSELVHNESD